MKTKNFYSIIVAKDYEKTIEFYETLGFSKKHEVSRPFGKVCVIENEAGALLEIMQQTSEDTPKELQMKEPGFVGMRTNVDDIEAAIEEFKAIGATIITGPIEMSVGRGAIIRDPNGVQITVIQHIKK